MNRREFVKAALLAAIAPSLSIAATVPDDIRITRIVGFDLFSKRNKIAGKNAFLGVHGDSATDPLVRIYTSAGVDGFGFSRSSQEDLAKLLGKSVNELFKADDLRFDSPVKSQTMPLWDLLGKLQKKPVWELTGAKPDAKVGVYDGSIYFIDLFPEHEHDWQDEFKRQIDQGLALGHRGFKCKMGRGFKWMPRAEGDDRDVAVIKLIRAHAGKDVLLGIDANNGYDLEGAKRFVERADCDLAFTEEMFPENVEQDRALKQFYKEKGFSTLVADGETQHDLNGFKPFIETQTLDILQGDMNSYGIEGIRAEAALAKPQGIKVAPHNWGSLMGFFHAIQTGASIENFYRAEHDPLTSPLLVVDGYAIKDGFVTPPALPGFGLALDEKRFAEKKLKFDLKA